MKKIKNLFNGKKWNSVRTRKKVLLFTISAVMIYTALNLLMTGFGLTPDSVLTSELFGFCKWLVVTGTSITLAEKVVPAKKDTIIDDDVEE